MKKLMLFVMVLLVSCSADDTTKHADGEAFVSFENSSTLTILYGISYGDAEFTGTLYPGEYTTYASTEPGIYPVMILTPSGWVSEGYSYKTKDGEYYTVELVGDATAYQYLMWLNE